MLGKMHEAGRAPPLDQDDVVSYCLTPASEYSLMIRPYRHD